MEWSIVGQLVSVWKQRAAWWFVFVKTGGLCDLWFLQKKIKKWHFAGTSASECKSGHHWLNINVF
jgi:hypothetical protein